jgi:adenylosuccinate synthase
VARERRAAIVVDLGFGDAGKGVVTDYLTRTLGATLVVRFNGGAQAGHNVVTAEGAHHTFAQLGAGSFVPGVRTHLARTTLVHPTALAVEASYLEARGVADPLSRVTVSEDALVVTPFHQAANRLRELARGAGRHGSCGAGVGEAARDAALSPEGALRVKDLRDGHGLRVRLTRAGEAKRAELVDVLAAARGAPGADAELRVLSDPAVIERWASAAKATLARVTVVDDAWLGAALAEAPAAVFEGAQGVLLDEWAGFHPYTTWSTCTFANALDLLRDARFDGEVARLGVLRTYAVRHGAGPFPTEDASLAGVLPEPHNEEGPWQGRVRRGWPDAVLVRYAVGACGGVDALALTHLDALPRVPRWQVCRAYEGAFDEAAEVASLPPPRARDLDRQAALTTALSRVRPVYAPVAWGSGDAGAAAAIGWFEHAVGAPVRLTAWGPRAVDLRAR